MTWIFEHPMQTQKQNSKTWTKSNLKNVQSEILSHGQVDVFTSKKDVHGENISLRKGTIGI